MFTLCALLSFLVQSVLSTELYENNALKWIHHINAQNNNWQAGENPYFYGKSMDDIRSLMGSKLDFRKLQRKLPEKTVSTAAAKSLPKQYVVGKQKWQKCSSTVNFIKDQSDCGSCWAMAATNVMAARICMTNYDVMPETATLAENAPAIDMSTEQITACCSSNVDHGCFGGFAEDALYYWKNHGVVTGGWYGSNCGCQPYSIKPCGSQPCHSHSNTPDCLDTCQKGYRIPFQKDKHYATDVYSLAKEPAKLQQEIYEHGPIECSMVVHENFIHYTSGVYDKSEGGVMGGHAVTLIGWGEERGVPYWLINNSWNTTWGMNGQVKFLRGKNLSFMESYCVAGKAKANDTNFLLTCGDK